LHSVAGKEAQVSTHRDQTFECALKLAAFELLEHSGAHAAALPLGAGGERFVMVGTPDEIRRFLDGNPGVDEARYDRPMLAGNVTSFHSRQR
jgi:hypothetical protein